MLFKVKFTNKNRRKQTAVSSLRFGKCLLNDILGLFGKHGSRFCEFCRVKENVTHLLIDY